jgi:hypothetical protein
MRTEESMAPRLVRARKKPLGRAQSDSSEVSIQIRLRAPMLKALDTYIADFSEGRSRPEAIRLILENTFNVHGLLPLK